MLNTTSITYPQVRRERNLAFAFAAAGLVFLVYIIFSGAGGGVSTPPFLQKTEAASQDRGALETPAKLALNIAEQRNQPVEGAGVLPSAPLEVREHPEPVPLSEPTPRSTRGPDARVRWRGPLAAGLYLLEQGKAGEVLKWIDSSDTPQRRAVSYPLGVLKARALAASSNWEEAQKEFERIANATVSSALHQQAYMDAVFGIEMCRAGGRIEAISREALEKMLKAPQACWGSGMAAYAWAGRLPFSKVPVGEHAEQLRALLQVALLTDGLDPHLEAECCKRLTSLTWDMLVAPKATQLGAVRYTVQPGDSLYKIAKKHGVEAGQLCRLNKMDPKTLLLSGKTLTVLPGGVEVLVDRWRLNATLLVGGHFIKRYPVCIGSDAKTPVGSFRIEKKLVHPDWYFHGKRYPYGSSENILGTRWLGFKPQDNGGQGAGIGIHGTTLPESVPGRESHGCVRMLNADAEELYDFVPKGAQVTLNE